MIEKQIMSKNIVKRKIDTTELPLHVALRKLKQQVVDSGKMEELKKRMFYEKPTTVRKRKAGAARVRWIKKLKDQELPRKKY